jgi:K(+)-stimulated pyrophosphate-energized sodium pump
VIADNVGDNVGDIAGMGADLFESYFDSIIAAMAVAVTVSLLSQGALTQFPVLLASIGVAGSMAGILFVMSGKGNPERLLNRGIFLATAIVLAGSYGLASWLGLGLEVVWCVAAGLLSGVAIGLSAEHYTSRDKPPVRRIAEASRAGAGTNIISGLSVGMMSTLIPVLVVAAAILVSYYFMQLYGIAIAAVGMLSTLGIILATDSYGPIADNAAGIAEMSGAGKAARENAEQLDAVGNTTAAINKGFAVGSAALTSLALFSAYSQAVGIQVINLIDPGVVVGLLLGGMLPFLFSSYTMKAVGNAAAKMVEEVRRQFKSKPGILKGTSTPDYGRCIEISTNSAMREMVQPALLAIIAPLAVGFVLGAQALAGLLAGAIVTGFLMALLMSNAGAAWDNSKKYIEAGNLGGKGSDTHAAAVVGDTVGDPFKDTAGPSLNILIKLMSIVALVFVPLLI